MADTLGSRPESVRTDSHPRPILASAAENPGKTSQQGPDEAIRVAVGSPIQRTQECGKVQFFWADCDQRFSNASFAGGGTTPSIAGTTNSFGENNHKKSNPSKVGLSEASRRLWRNRPLKDRVAPEHFNR